MTAPLSPDPAAVPPKSAHSPDEITRALAARLNPRIRLGASTCSYPSWTGILWDEGPLS